MKKYKGFTLIELMIVIVVIGILASMMAIASSESMSTAKASNIISNLRNFSMAAMAFYTDEVDTYSKSPYTAKDITNDGLKKYLHNEGDIPDKDKYHVIKDDENTWWAGYVFNNADNERVKEKLEGRAASANLKGSSSAELLADKKNASEFKKNDVSVWIKIRSSKKK